MASDFDRVSQVHTSAEVEPYVRPATDVQRAEQELREKYRLRYEVAQVAYNYAPALVARHGSRNMNDLIATLRERYGLSFKMPRELALAQAQEGRLQEEVLASVLRSEGFTFEDGLLVYSDRGTTVARIINTINLHEQNFQVQVVGRTGEAEFVASSVINDFIRSATPERAWEEFLTAADTIRYDTITRLELPVSVDELLGSKLSEYLDDLATSAMAPRFGYRFLNEGFDDPSRFKTTITLHDLQFGVAVTSKTSGSSAEGHLRFSIANRMHRGGKLVNVISSLPSDEHVLAMHRLIEKLVE